MGIRGNGKGDQASDVAAELEILDGDAPAVATETLGSAETGTRSRPLAILLGVFLVGWLALALLSPPETATDTAPSTTEVSPATQSTTAAPSDSTIPTTVATTSSTTVPAPTIAKRVALADFEPLFGASVSDPGQGSVRVVVDANPQTVWDIDITSGLAEQFDLGALSLRSRVGLRFVDQNTLYGFDEVDRHIALVQLGPDVATPAVEAHSFRPAGGAPTGIRGLDAGRDGQLAMWTTASSGLTRYQLATGEVDAQWNDPDRNFALTPSVRGVSNGELIVQSPAGSHHGIDDQGAVRSLESTQPLGRIEVVAGPWALVTSCDAELNCEEVDLVDLRTGQRTIGLGPWRSFVPACALGADNGVVAAGVDIEGALVLLTYDRSTREVATTQLADRSLACVDLARYSPSDDTFILTHSRGGLLAVDAAAGTVIDIDVQALGGKAVSVTGSPSN